MNLLYHLEFLRQQCKNHVLEAYNPWYTSRIERALNFIIKEFGVEDLDVIVMFKEGSK